MYSIQIVMFLTGGEVPKYEETADYRIQDPHGVLYLAKLS
jgi:hypothetical protein